MSLYDGKIPSKGSSLAASGVYRSRSSGLVSWGAYTPWFLTNTWEIVSTDHPGFRQSDGDRGGFFYLKKKTYSINKSSIKVGISNRFEGDFFSQGPSGWTLIALPGAMSETNMNARGTTAFGRVEPTSPSTNLLVASAEIVREGIPSALGVETWKNRSNLARGAGSEYLNYQFGWGPLVRDVRSLAKSVKEHDKIIAQYRKGSDTKIRRRYDFPSDQRSQSVVSGAFIPFPTQYNTFGSGVQIDTSLDRTWFEGAFRYHVPMSANGESKLAEHFSYANKILGVKLTPEVLWNLAPWSWAADWFANTGDIMRNISALGTDGLVMQYGYVMNHTQRIISRAATFNGVTSSVKITDDTKFRRAATPYGFGIDLNALSSKQTAILVALGLTRGMR